MVNKVYYTYEPNLTLIIDEVESRLKQTIPAMNDDYTLPVDFMKNKSVVYGEPGFGGADSSMSGSHVASLQPAVIKLNELQVQSQLNYWNIQQIFSKHL